jgi:hypothetical protein
MNYAAKRTDCRMNGEPEVRAAMVLFSLRGEDMRIRFEQIGIPCGDIGASGEQRRYEYRLLHCERREWRLLLQVQAVVPTAQDRNRDNCRRRNGSAIARNCGAMDGLVLTFES